MSNFVALKKHIASPAALAQLKMALPSHITPEKFQRVAVTALINNPDISNCSETSVMNSLMKCAADGLLPDNREAALVKYGSVAQYLPMVYGLIKRMRNSGEVDDVNAHCVYENDIFEYEIKNGVEELRHKPCLTGNRGQFLLAYCVVSIKDGKPHIEIMMKAEIDKTRAVSRASGKGPWVDWYDEMAKKAVIHRASKRVPTSADVMDFLREDIRITNQEPETVQGGQSLIDSINEAIDVEPMQQPEPQPVQQQEQQAVQPQVQEAVIDTSEERLATAPQNIDDMFPLDRPNA